MKLRLRILELPDVGVLSPPDDHFAIVPVTIETLADTETTTITHTTKYVDDHWEVHDTEIRYRL